MGKLPEQRKLSPEEFPNESWISALLSPLNRFIDDVVRVFNKQITVKDNFDGDVITAIIDGVYPLDVKWTQKNPPKAAWIGQCREISNNHTNFTDPLFLDWEFTASGSFRINNITGLTASSTNKFNITVVAIAG